MEGLRKPGRWARVAGALLAVLLLVGASAPRRAAAAAMRVLFIGNSYTYYNAMPGMFADLMRAGGHGVAVGMVAVGGATLARHLAERRALDAVDRGGWDYVVLQEQSVLPSLAGQREAEMYPAVRQFDEHIRRAGAHTVLFLTWGRRDGLPERGFPTMAAMQAQLDAGYGQIAREIGATIAPVGTAWQKALARDPALKLWAHDGSHPSAEGSYLAACVFYATLSHQSPEGLPCRAGLSDAHARLLQRIAAETVLH